MSMMVRQSLAAHHKMICSCKVTFLPSFGENIKPGADLPLSYEQNGMGYLAPASLDLLHVIHATPSTIVCK